MSGLFSKPKMPEPPAPAPMQPSDEDLLKAKKRALLGQQARGGRQSTILSDTTKTDTLG